MVCLAFVDYRMSSKCWLRVRPNFQHPVQFTRPSPLSTVPETWWVILTRHSCVLVDNVSRSRYTDGTETRSTTLNETSSEYFLLTHCRVSTKPKNPPYQRMHFRMSFANFQISTMMSTSSPIPRWKCSVLYSRVILVSK